MDPNMFFLLDALPAGRVFALDAQMLTSIIIQLLNVSILAFFLSRILYNPVRTFMLNRTIRVRDQIKSAEDNMAEANNLKAMYEQKVKEINFERDSILDEARKKAAERSKQMIAEVKAETDAMKSRAAQEIELERERAKDEIKDAIIDISSDIAVKFISNTMDRATQEKLFAEALAEIDSTVFRSSEKAV